MKYALVTVIATLVFSVAAAPGGYEKPAKCIAKNDKCEWSAKALTGSKACCKGTKCSGTEKKKKGECKQCAAEWKECKFNSKDKTHNCCEGYCHIWISKEGSCNRKDDTVKGVCKQIKKNAHKKKKEHNRHDGKVQKGKPCKVEKEGKPFGDCCDGQTCKLEKGKKTGKGVCVDGPKDSDIDYLEEHCDDDNDNDRNWAWKGKDKKDDKKKDDKKDDHKKDDKKKDDHKKDDKKKDDKKDDHKKDDKKDDKKKDDKKDHKKDDKKDDHKKDDKKDHKKDDKKDDHKKDDKKKCTPDDKPCKENDDCCKGSKCVEAKNKYRRGNYEPKPKKVCKKEEKCLDKGAKCTGKENKCCKDLECTEGPLVKRGVVIVDKYCKPKCTKKEGDKCEGAGQGNCCKDYSCVLKSNKSKRGGKPEYVCKKNTIIPKKTG